MRQHTPGPWIVSGSPAKTVRTYRQDPKRARTICVLTFGSTPRDPVAYKASIWATQMNARLISAAPDLLAALRAVTEAWATVPETAQAPEAINNEALWEAARKAIAKAESQTI